MVRQYCYVSHKGCSIIKHLCTGSCCLLCCQPNCKNRFGYITSSKHSKQPSRRTGFKCETCGFGLGWQDCLDKHIETRLCSLYFKCSSCSGTIPRHSIANHRCSKKRCSICPQYFDHSSQEVHECFVQRPKINVKNFSTTNVPGSSTHLFNEREEGPFVDGACNWFLDIETEEICKNRNGHVPVLLVVQNKEDLEYVFFGYDFIADFCASVSKDEARVRKQEWLIAHFGSGFDFLPNLQWSYKQQTFVPKNLLRGNKVVSSKVGKKRFIDSYLFIPIPLANFTKTFGLKDLRKSFFPHFLTSSPEAFSEPAFTLRLQSNEWLSLTIKVFSRLLSQRKNYEATSSVYNFRQEHIEYCRSDVTFLREGVSRCRRLIRKSCQNIDSFKAAVTAASACNYIYRQLFVPKNSVGIISNNGYRCLDKTSFPAVGMGQTKGIKDAKEQRESIEVFKLGIISNGRAKEGEQRIGPCQVDSLLAYKDNQTSSGSSHQAKILKFLGCYHNTDVCRLELNKKGKMRMGDLHLVSVEERLSWLEKTKGTQNSIYDIKRFEYFCKDIGTRWECHFSKILEKGDNELNGDQSDLEMQKKSFFNFTPLKAREAFAGEEQKTSVPSGTKIAGTENFIV